MKAWLCLPHLWAKFVCKGSLRLLQGSLTLANNTRPVKAYWDLHLHCHRFEHKGDSKPLCFWVRARGGKELVRRRWSQLMWANCWRSSLEYVVVIIPGPASNTPLPTASPSEWLPPQVTQDLTPLPLVKEEMFRKVYMHVHVLSTVRLISFIVQAGIDSLTLKINYVLQTHEIALKDLTSLPLMKEKIDIQESMYAC